MTAAQALIIDDDPKNVNVVSHLLSGAGLRSISVTDPRKLETIVQQLQDCSVVFLDLEMAGKDGFQVLQELKTDPRFQTVPIIACTVHVSEIQVAYQRGFNGFIGKPLDSDRFPDQLARILNGEAVWEVP
jgi:two-component system cell cycle response regulator DivK